MKIIFMGTPDLARTVLDSLIDAGHEVVLAVTQPDKARGRGKKVQGSPVKERALTAGIEVFQPRRIREPEAVEKLRDTEADVMIVAAFGQILPRDILEMKRYGCINVHASLLPAYRGAAPIQWAVINGEEESGVTIMRMDEGLDTGDILMQGKVILEPKETAGSLYEKIAAMGGDLCVKVLKDIPGGTLTPRKQGTETTPYARMLDKKMGDIQWEDSAVSIERKIRGFHPWPGAYSHREGDLIKIWEADVVPAESRELPGTVIGTDKTGFTVQTGEGALLVRSLQLQGKKQMDAEAFLRGYPINVGDRLGPGAD